MPDVFLQHNLVPLLVPMCALLRRRSRWLGSETVWAALSHKPQAGQQLGQLGIPQKSLNVSNILLARSLGYQRSTRLADKTRAVRNMGIWHVSGCQGPLRNKQTFNRIGLCATNQGLFFHARNIAELCRVSPRPCLKQWVRDGLPKREWVSTHSCMERHRLSLAWMPCKPLDAYLNCHHFNKKLNLPSLDLANNGDACREAGCFLIVYLTVQASKNLT